MVEWKFVVEVIVILATIAVVLIFFMMNYQSLVSQFFDFLDKALGWVFR